MNISEFNKSFISSVLIIVLMFWTPCEALALSVSNSSNLLENGTQMVLRVNENFNAANVAETGTISATVDGDVYSSDGSRVLIKSGTPATIEFTADSNGFWGKAGKLYMTHAYTKTVDNKRVSLRLSVSKSGGSKIGGVIALSVIFFPIGLISGCMKGSMPKIHEGTTYNASVIQDIIVE